MIINIITSYYLVFSLFLKAHHSASVASALALPVLQAKSYEVTMVLSVWLLLIIMLLSIYYWVT